MKKQSDILARNRQSVASIGQQFDSAVSAITGAVHQLEAINASIDSQTQEIEAYQSQLNAARDDLSVAKRRNESVIRKLNDLVAVED